MSVGVFDQDGCLSQQEVQVVLLFVRLQGLNDSVKVHLTQRLLQLCQEAFRPAGFTFFRHSHWHAGFLLQGETKYLHNQIITRMWCKLDSDWLKLLESVDFSQRQTWRPDHTFFWKCLFNQWCWIVQALFVCVMLNVSISNLMHIKEIWDRTLNTQTCSWTSLILRLPPRSSSFIFPSHCRDSSDKQFVFKGKSNIGKILKPHKSENQK